MKNLSPQTRPRRSPADEDARKLVLFNRVLAGKLRLEGARRQLGLSRSALSEWLQSCRRTALLAFDEQLRQRLMVRGAPAEALSGALFSGSLSELAMADLLQLFELTGKSAVLMVTNEGARGQLWCSAGTVIDAVCGPLSGELAAYRLLGWERGTLLAELQESQRPQVIACSTQQLLLEAARRKDECARLLGALGGEQRALQVSSEATTASEPERALSGYFAAPRLLGEVLELSPLGDLETLQALQQLLARGALVDAPAAELAAAALVRATPEGPSWLDHRSGPSRRALNAVSHLLSLPAAAWLGNKVSSALTPPPPARHQSK